MSGKIKWFDILRVAGLALVLTYHFFKDILPGGFLGVDVFYTFSGYLITALAVEEFRKSKSFSLGRFFTRRFQRIFPPLALMVLTTLPLALLISPDFTAGIGKQVASALGFVTNYFEILTGGSYEARMLPHLYVHTWFLALEAHLYIVWGLACACAALFLRGRAQGQVTGFKGWLIALGALLAALSFVHMQLVYGDGSADPSPAYFGSTTRAFPFFIGCIAGALMGMKVQGGLRRFITGAPVRILSLVTLPASILGLFALARYLDFSGAFTYRYGFLCASLLAVAAIWSARVLHESTPEKMREPRIVTWLAELSFGVYLFHWPLYVISSQLIDNNPLAALCAFAASILCSALVTWGAEPLLRGKWKPRGNSLAKLGYAALAAVILSCGALGGLVLLRAPQISSLEQELYAGYMRQDYDGLYSLKGMADALNPQPVALDALPRIDDRGGDPSQGGNVNQGAEPAVPSGIPAGVTVIGDSVCLGARVELGEAIENSAVDATGSRSLALGYDMVMQMQEAGTLREYVVLSLGANVTQDALEKIDQIIEELEPGHRLVFVTPYSSTAAATSITRRTAEHMRTLPEQYPFVTVADWAAAIEPQKNLLGSDGIHIGGNETAKGLYIQCILDALSAAAEKPAS